LDYVTFENGDAPECAIANYSTISLLLHATKTLLTYRVILEKTRAKAEDEIVYRVYIYYIYI